MGVITKLTTQSGIGATLSDPAGNGLPAAEDELAALKQELATVQAQLHAHQQAQQLRYCALVNSLPGGVMLTNREGRALAINAHCRELFGLPGAVGADSKGNADQ